MSEQQEKITPRPLLPGRKVNRGVKPQTPVLKPGVTRQQALADLDLDEFLAEDAEAFLKIFKLPGGE